MFGIIKFNVPKSEQHKAVIPKPEAPQIIEGVEIIETLLPVNPLTGKRESLPSIVKSLSSNPEKARLLDALAQEIPSIRSNPNLSDDDRFDMVMDRLESGTPAEDDIIASRLVKVADVIFRGRPEKVVEAAPVSDASPDAAPTTE